MCHTLIFVLNKKKYFYHFLAFFSTLPSTKTIKVIDLIFEKLGFDHAIQPYTYSLKWGGGVGRPPSLYIDSDPL